MIQSAVANVVLTRNPPLSMCFPLIFVMSVMSGLITDQQLNVNVGVPSRPVQMQYIDALDGEDLLLTGEVKWRPLVEENAQSILKVATPTYNDTGL